MVPTLLFLIPDSNFDLRFVIGRVNVLWESEYNIDRIFLHESTRVRERNVPQSLINGQDASHHPLVGGSALLWIGVHLEVDDATDDNVILDLRRSDVVVARPQASKHQHLRGLLVRQDGRIIAKSDFSTS